MPKEYKSVRVKLKIAAILALLVAIVEGSIYAFANIHLTEIQRNGSAPFLFGLLTVTPDFALANPHMTLTVVCALVSAACFTGLYILRRKFGSPKAKEE